jgi:transcriptional regulator
MASRPSRRTAPPHRYAEGSAEMLIHPWDEVGPDRWSELLRGPTFGQLVTAGLVDGFPVVVPTHFTFDGRRTAVLHLARPNPVWQALSADPAVVLAVATDYAYVEAAWNTDAGKDPELGIPTSYYAAVQLRGRATVVDDPDEKAEILGIQLAHLEPPDSRRRLPSSAVEEDRRVLPGIRGIRVDVEQVLAKMKYGGNKSPDHRRQVAKQLARRDQGLDAAASARVTDLLEGGRKATVSPERGGMGQA